MAFIDSWANGKENKQFFSLIVSNSVTVFEDLKKKMQAKTKLHNLVQSRIAEGCWSVSGGSRHATLVKDKDW